MATPIADQLHHKLLGQDFTGTDTAWPQEQLKALAELYAETEQAIAVLSDMQANRSYICYGGIAATLGISCPVQHKTIDSIWEEEIFSGTHPDDLQNKYFLELQFFNTVKQLPQAQRHGLFAIHPLRIRNRNNQYGTILHRIFYPRTSTPEELRFALCLYTFPSYQALPPRNGCIVNPVTGALIPADHNRSRNILSRREKEILSWIDKGKMSKEIADLLSISIHTVNRHRQNILEKLHVSNAMEACRMARMMGVL